MRKTSRNGGILGSGIFGGIGVGSVVQCSSTDTSFFCRLSKLVSTIGMLIFLLFIIFIVYMLLKNVLFNSKGRVSSGKRR